MTEAEYKAFVDSQQGLVNDLKNYSFLLSKSHRLHLVPLLESKHYQLLGQFGKQIRKIRHRRNVHELHGDIQKGHDESSCDDEEGDSSVEEEDEDSIDDDDEDPVDDKQASKWGDQSSVEEEECESSAEGVDDDSDDDNVEDPVVDHPDSKSGDESSVYGDAGNSSADEDEEDEEDDSDDDEVEDPASLKFEKVIIMEHDCMPLPFAGIQGVDYNLPTPMVEDMARYYVKHNVWCLFQGERDENDHLCSYPELNGSVVTCSGTRTCHGNFSVGVLWSLLFPRLRVVKFWGWVERYENARETGLNAPA